MDSLPRITLSDTFQNKSPEVFHKQVPNVKLASKHRNIRASQAALVVKNQPENVGDVTDMGSIPGSGRSAGGGHGNTLQYSCLEKYHRQRSLAGYSLWVHKQWDTTEVTLAHTQFAQ